MKLLTIIGARPQIIKAAAFSRAIAQYNRQMANGNGQWQMADGNGQWQMDGIQEVILHTGQHYDDNMSAVFFRELGIPAPDINLHVGSGSHGVQTARMIEGIEQVLKEGEMSEKPFDGVVLYGDTNSTLAGAVAASKMHIPVFHIEAGLRSWNMGMPEEINRIVSDDLSSVLFTPTATGMENLLAAGFQAKRREGKIGEEARRREGEEARRREGEKAKGRVHFQNGKGQYVVQSGDVMYDNSMYFATMAETKTDIIERLGLTPKQFVLATIHRPANTDNAEKLNAIFRALLEIAKGEVGEVGETARGLQVVLPLHPRTRKMLPQMLSKELLEQVENCANIRMTEPASFFEIIRLEKHARIVLTDSGGVQKEAFFFSTPCVILRPETEWVEIVDAGAGILADADYDRILAAYRKLVDTEVHFPALFGDGHAAEKIVGEIVAYLR